MYTEHNTWDSYRRSTYLANMWTFPLNDSVIAVSDEVRASMRYPTPFGALGMPTVRTVLHGIDIESIKAAGVQDGVREEFGIPSGAPLVITVANFRREKGHGTLLAAAEMLRERMPDARFMLVGQGPLEGEVRDSAAHLKGTVVFAGSRSDVPRIVSAADVFALPSDFEGLPIALLEAMALGRPCVVTGVGGVTEVVRDGVEAVVVPPQSPSRLADGLLSLLRDEDRRRSLGQAASTRATEFHISRAVKQIESIYHEALG
jgi:glycosyltransferase involved in cell wall biosynthesis